MAKKTIYLVTTSFLALLFGGCSEMSRRARTELRPTEVESDYQYFEFKVLRYGTLADVEDYEKEDIKWLEDSLAENGFPNPEYEIISRKPIKHILELVLEAYDVYYRVRVKLMK